MKILKITLLIVVLISGTFASSNFSDKQMQDKNLDSNNELEEDKRITTGFDVLEKSITQIKESTSRCSQEEYERLIDDLMNLCSDLNIL